MSDDDQQIPRGGTEMGLGAHTPVLVLLGPYETLEKLHGNLAPSFEAGQI